MKWTKVRAYDANSFIIERSTNGVNFKEIGSIAVSSNSRLTASQYFFFDINAATGKSYYRLRIIKANGGIFYSNVEMEIKLGKVAVSVMPNPVTSSFTIRFQTAPVTSYGVSLVGADGKIILHYTYAAGPGDAKTIERPSSVATGVYYLLVVNQQTNEKDIIKLFFN